MDRLEIECEMKDKTIVKLQANIDDAVAEASRVKTRHEEEIMQLRKQFEDDMLRKEAEMEKLHAAGLQAKADELEALSEAQKQENEKFRLAGEKINALVRDVESAREDARVARSAAVRDASALAQEKKRSEESKKASKAECEALREELLDVKDKLYEVEQLKSNEVAASIAELEKIRSEKQALVDAASAQHEQTLEFKDMLKNCMEKCKAHEQDADEKSETVRESLCS